MTDPTRVAFQGKAGALSEQALLAAIHQPVVPSGVDSFEEVGRAVVDNEVGFGFLPLENTLAGSVTPSYDVLASRRLKVLAEVIMPIEHCLLGTRGAHLAGVRRVISHPVALAQCTRFLRDNPAIRAGVVSDTAGAAAEVAATRDAETAAIAPLGCARHYGLDVLLRGVEDRQDNQTRFVLVTREHDEEPFHLVEGAASHVILEAEIPHETGALARLLELLAEHGHNLTKIEARPAATPWTYRFFLEFEPAHSTSWRGRLHAGTRHDWSLRVVGAFPRVVVGGAPAPTSTRPEERLARVSR